MYIEQLPALNLASAANKFCQNLPDSQRSRCCRHRFVVSDLHTRPKSRHTHVLVLRQYEHRGARKGIVWVAKEGKGAVRK